MAPSKTDESLAWRNKHAWNALYQSTDQEIWGKEPVGFLPEFTGLLHECLLDLPSVRVLDAATGEGRNLDSLLQLVAGEGIDGRLVCCDSSKEALRKIPTSIREQLEIVHCDLAETPFPDGSFDLVLMSDVIETLPNLEEVLGEIHRILKPGGWLLCNIPGDDDPVADHQMVALSANPGALYQDRYFFHFYEKEEAEALLAVHGLTVEYSQACRWEEAAHPNFRSVPHEHESNVFLARKSMGCGEGS
ncbi:MAG: class I SAM-dependent methyltransferase [Verrucomicrobiae bacterium]|nr:class I SAM-dependent methyltransferase [Verrucomicrobiae bacterium]